LFSRNTAIRVIAMLSISGVLYAEEHDPVLVKRGETFSQIALKYIGKPVYSKQNGSLQKLAELNPEIKNVDKIFPGQKIYLASRDTRVISSIENHDLVAVTETGDLDAPAGSHTPGPNLKKNPSVPVTGQAVQASAPDVTPLAPKVAAEKTAELNREAAPQPDSQEVSHRLTLSAGYAMTTLHAQDPVSGTSADLNSSHDLKLEAGWKQEWSDTFSSAFKAEVRAIDFEPSTNSAKQLSGSSKTNTAFTLGFENKISSRFTLLYGAGYESELFIHGINSSSTTVDSVPVPKGFAGIDWNFYARGKTSVGVRGTYAYLFSASTDAYPVNAGQEYLGLLYVRRRYGDSNSVELDLGFKSRTQNTGLLNLNENSVFGTLTFELPLFEGGHGK
jgi:LysM domain